MTQVKAVADPVWQLHFGDGPLIATAIHDGHAVRDEVALLLELDEATRLREEDPFTGEWTEIAPTRVVGRRSRFEVDLNRPRDEAVYRKPEDAWGLTVWNRELPEEVIARSLSQYDAFYDTMRELLLEIEQQYGRFFVYDLHTYNHRRDGSGSPQADPEKNPQVNVGTGTMERSRWTPVVDCFIETLGACDFPGGKLDVRENVRFEGGNWPRWIHQTFPNTGVALAIEVKKFFMDEWSGQPDLELVEAVGSALRFTVPRVLEELKRL
jgi:N-formylglutamate amidohydrolase